MVASLSDRLSRMNTKQREKFECPDHLPWEECLSSSALPARKSLFLVVCFIGVSHILDFFFRLGFFPHGFGNMGYIRFIAQGIALVEVVGVEVKKRQVVGSGM